MSGPVKAFLDRLRVVASTLGVSLDEAAAHMDGSIKVTEAIKSRDGESALAAPAIVIPTDRLVVKGPEEPQ